MDVNMPDEIQEKLRIIKKEAEFSRKMIPPNKRQLWYVLVADVGLFLLSIVFAVEGEYFQAIFSAIVAVLFIINHFEYKNLYKLHSNACDIISYYRSKEAK